VNRADFDLLRRTATETGSRIQVGFQSLGSHALDAFSRDEFNLGPLQAVGAVGLWARNKGYWARSRWAGKRSIDGIDVVDGVSANPLAHAIVTALAVVSAHDVSDVTQVDADLYRANDIEGDDTSLLRISTTSGTTVTAGLTLCAEEQSDAFLILRGTRASARFYYTEDIVEIDGRRIDFARTDLLENLLDHRDHGTPLLSSLESTGAFVRVIDTVRRTQPAPIAEAFVEWRGEGAEARPIVEQVDEWIARAVDAEATFAELGAPWARSGTNRCSSGRSDRAHTVRTGAPPADAIQRVRRSANADQP
jgi:hypothetical protein